MGRRWLRFLILGGPLVLWMGVILLSGSEGARYEASWKLIQQALRVLCPEQAPPGDGSEIQVTVTMYQINGALRRIAHVVAYAVLALLTVRAIQAGEPRLKPKALLAAFGLGIVYTAVDEVHRYFQQNRHAKWDDVWLNLAGVFLTVLLTMGYFGGKALERKILSSEVATAGEGRLSKHPDDSPGTAGGKDE
ncbi:MAG: VanZ family protein [Capsulimonadales bacterium]|nr:VanZ family protein [Capsulimonadales bacterium]